MMSLRRFILCTVGSCFFVSQLIGAVEWQVINIDSRRRLVPTDAAKAYFRFDVDPDTIP